MMTPKIVCRECGGELALSDKFCSVCGSKVEWQDGSFEKNASLPQTDVPKTQQEEICPLCGHKNSPGRSSCVSCGGALTSATAQKFSRPAGSVASVGRLPKSIPLKKLQSWKLTAALGIVLIVTLIVTRMMNQHSETDKLPPQHAAIVKEIEALESQLKENPNDAGALLQLGNIYYDQKLFARGIMMYDRYLQINPSNPDARVDLGTSYFQLALSDSTRRQEYFASAKTEIEKALHYAPKHQLACFNLGMVNLHTGEMEKATEWFKKCADIDSSSETGKRAQQLIKQQSITHPPSS